MWSLETTNNYIDNQLVSFQKLFVCIKEISAFLSVSGLQVGGLP